MKVIGVTGPTGGGKTTLLRRLESRGWEGVDCDRLYDRLLKDDAGLRTSLERAFGSIFLPDGQLNRRQLAERVFQEPKELEMLNGIVYPVIRQAVAGILANSQQEGVVIDAVNLFQADLAALCGVTIGVSSPVSLRLRRIMARDGLEETRAMARIAAQPPDSFYRERCTVFLWNGGTDPAEFDRAVDETLQKLFV